MELNLLALLRYTTGTHWQNQIGSFTYATHSTVREYLGYGIGDVSPVTLSSGIEQNSFRDDFHLPELNTKTVLGIFASSKLKIKAVLGTFSLSRIDMATHRTNPRSNGMMVLNMSEKTIYTLIYFNLVFFDIFRLAFN